MNKKENPTSNSYQNPVPKFPPRPILAVSGAKFSTPPRRTQSRKFSSAPVLCHLVCAIFAGPNSMAPCNLQTYLIKIYGEMVI